ncbi:MAG: hypothetical protein JWR26_229 [Pedosphaera sp.]|nr:hypothetical protein [Pedosphaera sp.]
MEAIDLPTAAPPLYSTGMTRFYLKDGIPVFVKDVSHFLK